MRDTILVAELPSDLNKNKNTEKFFPIEVNLLIYFVRQCNQQ